MTIPKDYVERVYAGVLGKIIGVYLGRPFEGWSYDSIMKHLGEIWYYVHETMGSPLILTDDDITGTFTFLRALPDYGNTLDLTPAQIGQSWLNYIIEKRTILWWGGLGNSTEHTAYLRLKNGIEAPRSGSIELNGKVVSEQIGAQIFIDGWAMVAPGDPELAADLARRAGSVSHDGEAIYGAQVLAAMEALAFVESDMDTLLDAGVSFIPKDSVIARMIADLRRWRAEESDWRRAFGLLKADYGYDKYGGNCHMVPNHGLIILSLLYGDDDFQKTMMIVNTCGWDTDCNSGNVGCLMGIKNGLDGLDAGPDWRGPVADRLYLPAADGGRGITDAVTEAYHITNIGRELAGDDPLSPKDGARFHFELPGSVQGFQPEPTAPPNISFQKKPGQSGTAGPHDSSYPASVENVPGHSRLGTRSLALRYHHVGTGRPARVATSTFIPLDAIDMPGYTLMASPTLYSGQTVRAGVIADEGNDRAVSCALYLRSYGADDKLIRNPGPKTLLKAGESHEFEWAINDTGGAPIADIGIEIHSEQRADGTVYLDYLTWDGEPDLTLTRPEHGGEMWKRAWVNGADDFYSFFYPGYPQETYRLMQNDGTGLLMQGTREWTDYRVTADVTPHMVEAAGIAVRVQGMRRYYALLLCRDGKVRMVKALDGNTILGESDFAWQFGETYEISLEATGISLKAWIGDRLLFEVEDSGRPLTGGAAALVCEGGRTTTQQVRIQPTEGVA